MRIITRDKENIASSLHKAAIGIYGFLAIFFIAIVSILAVLNWSSTNDYPYRDHMVFEDGWADETGRYVQIDKVNTSAELYKVLPETPERKLLFISLKTGNMKVYLDDEKLFETEIYDSWFLGTTPGYHFIEVYIPKGEAGRVLHLSVENPYGDHSTKIDDIYFGNGSSIMSAKLRQLMTPFCLGVLMTSIGVIFIIMFFILRTRFDNASKWIHIGVFALTTGVFVMMDSKMLQLMHGHAAIWHIIIEISLMMIPAPLFMYLIQEFNLKKRVYVFIVVLIDLLEVIVNLCLNLANVKEYHQTVFMTHFAFALIAIVSLHVVGTAVIKDFKHHIYDLIGLLVMLLGCLVDVILYYVSSISVTYIFLRIGVFGFLIFSAIQVMVSLLAEYEGNVKGDMIKRLAYHDGLTDLYNRTSFIEEMENLDKNVGECVLLAMFDVNNLKAVNDTLGHTAGDNLILAAAQALSAGFSEVGKVYRIGGDEFVVIITGDLIRDKFEKGLAIYEEKIKEQNLSQSTFTISAAVGVESNVVSDNCSMQSILEKADAAMYENKKEMKRGRKS